MSESLSQTLSDVPVETPVMAVIEALLFASENPLSVSDLVHLLNGDTRVASDQSAADERPAWNDDNVRAVMAALHEHYLSDPLRGYFLSQVAGGYQLRTKPEFARYVERLHKEKPHRLSRSAMETLSVVAYHQPVMRSTLEDIRGVDSSSALRTLLERGLIRVIGKSDDVGHPVLYGTAPLFLEVFNLNAIEDLSPLESLDALKQSLGDASGAVAFEQKSDADRQISNEGEDASHVLTRTSDPEQFAEEASIDLALLSELEAELSALTHVENDVVQTVFQPKKTNNDTLDATSPQDVSIQDETV